MKQILFTLMSAILMLTACSPAATATPVIDDGSVISSDDVTPPQPNPNPPSTNLQRGGVYLDSTDLLVLESYPLQFTLTLRGNLPTPCNHLKVDVAPPDAQNKIIVDAYSLVDPNTMCAEVLQPFEENVPLGGFPTGHYFIWVNGKQVAEFDA
ncbi:MAG: hypothetical protein PHQ36_10085 [Anaerolineales bacterium]|nr:hypothetical protein [Anaerolineales bacterium]